MMSLAKPSTCKNCLLESLGKGWVPADGTGRLGVLLLGEAAGKTEAASGRPFVGVSGGILGTAASAAGLRRDDFVIDNCVRCQPPNNFLEGAPWEARATAHCLPNWQATVERLKPRVIVPLGGTALHQVDEGLGLNISEVQGYVLPTLFMGAYVLPAYHPAFIVKGNHALIGLLARTLLRAARIARDGFQYGSEEFIENPQPSDLADFGRRLSLARDATLAFDLETPEIEKDAREEDDETDPSYTILRCSMCFERGRAISFPWKGEFIKIALWIFSMPHLKVGWNSRRFDVPRLLYNGVGQFPHVDTMMAWRFWQSSLSPKLKPNRLGWASGHLVDTAPWKHLATSRPEYYSAKDAAVTWAAYVEIKRQLEGLGVWQGFLESLAVWDCLDRVAGHGILIDADAQSNLRANLQARMDGICARLQDMVPLECRVLHPRKGGRVVGYKKLPKIVKEALLQSTEPPHVGQRCGDYVLVEVEDFPDAAGG